MLFQPVDGHAHCVCGPWQPSFDRHRLSCPYWDANCRALKFAMRQQRSCTVLPYRAMGRLEQSRGPTEFVRRAAIAQTIQSGCGGQPEILRVFFSVTAPTPLTPVGLGAAAATPPKEAQVPIAITAAARAE